jgi:hypothetical protein
MEISEQQKEQQVIADWKMTFTPDFAQRTLSRLSKFCLEKQTCYTQGDSHETAFNEGARSVILEIRRQLERNPMVEKQLETLNEKE